MACALFLNTWDECMERRTGLCSVASSLSDVGVERYMPGRAASHTLTDSALATMISPAPSLTALERAVGTTILGLASRETGVSRRDDDPRS
eukprot:CAMPEP_0167776614 /NCGR_PEP_ID=MMETSP0111_2-20121227/3224_1 /TAXON_ID=91324 /ORGANISM="Lotharella globosa, Strain CCCM811" /LENGTH=90 /DNA_ID=CAMNT_0007666683 /DNA_START=303 /DNA_END=571 /DNA_ORIENTATION=-